MRSTTRIFTYPCAGRRHSKGRAVCGYCHGHSPGVGLYRPCGVNNQVAMTGEVSLRGRVLPIGGLKEKALGALRAGIKQVIIPEKNKKDLYDIPRNVKSRLKFTCVSGCEPGAGDCPGTA